MRGTVATMGVTRAATIRRALCSEYAHTRANVGECWYGMLQGDSTHQSARMKKRRDAVEDELCGNGGEQHAQHTREDEDARRADTLLNLRADAHGNPGGDECQSGRDGDQGKIHY